METSLDKLDARIFAEQLHSRFDAQLGNAKIPLKLVSVQEHNFSPRTECYALIFHGPVSPRLPQMIYSLEHEKLGTFSLFITAVAGDAEGFSYEAVVNRIKKAGGS